MGFCARAYRHVGVHSGLVPAGGMAPPEADTEAKHARTNAVNTNKSIPPDAVGVRKLTQPAR